MKKSSAVQLFEFHQSVPDARDSSHRALERVLAEGKHPRAECREPDERGYYTVWSGPARED